MDESTCLLRSFSNPLEVSREVKEGDPIHALTQSISFGRFMSESLAWEKWSTFSHNRYLEEMEKLSKPGSVAEKKAFFEAHYKKRAAMRAAALLEQANIVTDEASQTGTINAPSAEPLLDADLANSNGSPAANQHGKYVSYADIANTGGVDACNLTLVRENIDVSDSEQGLAVMEEDVNMEECHRIQISNALESGDIHGKIMTTPKIPTPPEECADSKNSTSSSKKRRKSSSSKSSVPSKASKLPLHPSKRVASAQARSDANVAKPTRNLIEKRKPIPNSLLMSINVAGKTNKTPLRTTPPQTPTRVLKKAADQENLAPSSEKRRSNSSLKLPNHGRGSKQATSRTGNNHALINNKKPILDPNEQRRTAQKSLHMSMNFSPRPSETNKTFPKISRESSTPLQTPTRASVNGSSKHASKALQSRDKRTISVVNKSVSATGDGRWPSHSNCSQSSNASRTSTRSPISFCPFSFRSEERAAKRKEFFKKLEDKLDSKEAEKSQMQIKPKISSSRPPSPKLVRKPSPSVVQDASSRPPRMPSINTESSKNGLMKNRQITCSEMLLPKKQA